MSSDGGATTTALERRETALVPAALMSDDEIRRAYRIAEALWQSGAYKDVKKAETAFAKMVIGRDLGLSPAQAMSGIHLVEGGVQMHYSMLGQFVRSRVGYDYRAGWLKEVPPVGVPAEVTDRDIVVVWHDEEAAEDLRPIVGAVVEFTVDGARRGLSRFTLDDARQAGLIKASEKAAWNTAPRNMLLARAMSNGVKWFVPEVLGGMPVYVEGELGREQKSLTAETDEGGDEGQGIDLGPKVEAIIERATVLGHRGLSNRLAVELAVGQRAPGVVKQWLDDAKAELDRFERAKAEAQEGASPSEQPVAEEVTGEVVEAPEASQDDARARLAGNGEVEVSHDA